MAPAACAEPAPAEPEGLEAALERVTLPSLNFEGTTLPEALAYFHLRIPELAGKRIVDFDLVDPQGTLKARRLTLRARCLPIPVALRYFCISCGATARYHDRSITIEPGVFPDTRTDERKKADAALAQLREDAMKKVVVVSFLGEDLPLAEAVDHIRQYVTIRGVQPPATDMGIREPLGPPPLSNILILDPAGKLAGKRIANLHLKSVPATLALETIALACGARVRFEPFATIVEPL
ncbi:hypothetical protein llg_12620 [Luteolibacter sp. LG18]|nr:hypothetical protein llg_12620 [Luteolibacter sp. LG18]